METVLVVEDDRVYARTTTNWLVKNGINARYVLSVCYRTSRAPTHRPFWKAIRWICYCRIFA